MPSKSTLQRYDLWWPQTEVRQLIHQVLGTGATAPKQLHLPEAIDLETAFLDTTCLAVNIHYPVDWVLLRDATRTLMAAHLVRRTQSSGRRTAALGMVLILEHSMEARKVRRLR